jgi:adenylate cyclase
MEREGVQRRLAAVLYADVAGYSRLTGADEEGTHRTLSASLDFIAATVEERGGRVIHYAGDAVLAEFASVVVAVESAVEIQCGLAERNRDVEEQRRLLYRVGINLGDVIVDRDDIYGDGVNVAARLESLAEPGGICVSAKVRNEVGNKLDLAFEDMGEQRVKNIAEPVRAYRVAFEGMLAAEAEHSTAGRLRKRFARLGVRRRGILGSALALVVLLLAATLWPSTAPGPAVPPSIGVTPFRVIGGGGKAESFAEGLTEDLVTTLSRRSGINVLEGGGGTTGVIRYRVEGSIREAGARVRITARLVSAVDGFSVWGARYDREVTDVLGVQGDVAARIAFGLTGSVLTVEQERRERLAEQGRASWALMSILEGLGAVAEIAVGTGSSVIDWGMGISDGA